MRGMYKTGENMPEINNSKISTTDHMSENISFSRGSLRFSVNSSSPQVIAGSDFSIFVIIQNPFDVSVTINQVQTHIPVELNDIYWVRARKEILEIADKYRTPREGRVIDFLHKLWDQLTKKKYYGIAIAVGTNVDEFKKKFIESFKIRQEEQKKRKMEEHDNFISELSSLNPEKKMEESQKNKPIYLDDYLKFCDPIVLQPGDSVVKQFILRTNHWLFFTPLKHRFQIQVRYTEGKIDHVDTIAYEQEIRSTMSAMVIGAVCGAIISTLLKNINSFSNIGSLSQALIVSILASFAVVIAFARKSSVQPIVSIEDFWGGTIIGFTVGYFGFNDFEHLFGSLQK